MDWQRSTRAASPLPRALTAIAAVIGLALTPGTAPADIDTRAPAPPTAATPATIASASAHAFPRGRSSAALRNMTAQRLGGATPTAAAPVRTTFDAPAQAASPPPASSGAPKSPGSPESPGSPLTADEIPDTLTLADTLRLARTRNPALAAARAEADAAAADRLTAALRPNPALGVELSGYPLFGSPRPDFWNGQETTVRLDQEIEIGGRRRLRMAAAAAGADVARLDARNRARTLELEIERAYFTAVLAQTDRGVASTTLAEIDRVIALNRARFDQGEISGAELRRLQVERLRFVEDLFSAELALKNARSALLALLNAPRLDRAVALSDPLAAPPDAGGVAGTRPIATTDTVAAPAIDNNTALAPAAMNADDARIARALRERPDAQAARADRTRAEAETRLQQALRLPNVTAGIGYLRDRRIGSNGNGIIVSASVPLPFFDRNQGGIARAEAERRAADARTQAVDAIVRLDLQQALDTVSTSQARVHYIEREYLTPAREARDIVFESYRVGAADLIDYLDAQRAFRDTLRTYNRALFDERLSLFALAAAEGRTDLQP